MSDIEINSWKLRDDIREIVNKNCEEIEWEGTQVNKGGIVDSIINYLNENNVVKQIIHPNNIPTAKEFFNKKAEELHSDKEDMPEWMIEEAAEYAKLHVQGTVKAIQDSSVDGMEWIEELTTI